MRGLSERSTARTARASRTPAGLAVAVVAGISDLVSDRAPVGEGESPRGRLAPGVPPW
jgi:hypothetical protein